MIKDSLCFHCKYYDVLKCKAYPDKIPPEVYYSVVDHRLPYKGDRGVIFQVMDGETDEDIKKIFGGKKVTSVEKIERFLEMLADGWEF